MAISQSNTLPESGTSAAVSPCPCCGSNREISVFAKACNSNFTSIPHLGIEHFGYMPSEVGVPGCSDGPEIHVCLDCGRIKNGKYPVSDEQLWKETAYLREEV
ncbi:molybdopterin oxidoreductase [Novimethylophilus kurashikiensis]|uniref:Molybdopterin oxidoreductase n=1 Tax=Novimethylophilus kurashikiensis TaxID=1825523 RepID=A0A2R5F8K2_9PROT|nr:molybdopterin oxidoreductase [Novimethylophilus kurashikiensis]